jgi:FtsZ-binding cell division protein ZapB
VADSNEQFERLEEKLLRAIEVFKQTQAEKRTLERDGEKLRLEIKERAQEISLMERELIALRREREDVRARIDKLLKRLDALTSSGSEG